MLRKSLAVLFIMTYFASYAYGTWVLISSWPTPGANPRDLAFQGAGNPWIAVDGSPPIVYNCPNGSILASFVAPGGPGAWGLSQPGTPGGFFFSNNSTSYIYRITSTGSVITSFICPIPGPAGLKLVATGPPPRMRA